MHSITIVQTTKDGQDIILAIFSFDSPWQAAMAAIGYNRAARQHAGRDGFVSKAYVTPNQTD